MSKRTKILLFVLCGAIVVALITLPRVGLFDGSAENLSAAADADTKKPASGARRGGDGDPMPVHTQIVQRQWLGERIRTVGSIMANEEVDIRSEVSGRLERLYFREGAWVGRGQTLVKINDDELQAQLVTSRHRLKLAEQKEDRQRQLLEKKLTTQEEYDAVLADVNITRSQIALLQAQIAKTVIRAPFSGVVGLRHVSEGSYLTPSTPITTLQNNNPVKIEFTFPERYAANVKSGDDVSFTIQGSTRKFIGRIYAMPPRIDPETRTVRVRATSDNPDGALIPGAFADVEILLSEKHEMMVPTYAVVPDMRGHTVYLMRNGKAVVQPVVLGTRTDEHVQIIDGLDVGDTLITSAILQLREGMSVRPVEIQTKSTEARADTTVESARVES